MSESIGLALIAMIGASIVNITSSVMAYLKSRDAAMAAVRAADNSQANALAIHDVNKTVNGHLEKLVVAEKAASRSEGVIAGRQEEKEKDDVIRVDAKTLSEISKSIDILTMAVNKVNVAVDRIELLNRCHFDEKCHEDKPKSSISEDQNKKTG